MKGGNEESEANEVTLPLEPRSGSIFLAVGFNPIGINLRRKRVKIILLYWLEKILFYLFYF